MVTGRIVPAVLGVHSIVRTHEIHCGHRVCGHGGKCQHLHGHAYVFEFEVRETPRSDGQLDPLGMVTDFGVVKSTLVEWLERGWDHRFLMWIEDPWIERLAAIDPSVVPVPFNPTAERIAEHLVLSVGPQVLPSAVYLHAVTVHETGKCRARFELLRA